MGLRLELRLTAFSVRLSHPSYLSNSREDSAHISWQSYLFVCAGVARDVMPDLPSREIVQCLLRSLGLFGPAIAAVINLWC